MYKQYIFHNVIIIVALQISLPPPPPPPPTSPPSPSIIGGLFHCHCYQRSAKSTPNMHLSSQKNSIGPCHALKDHTKDTWYIPPLRNEKSCMIPNTQKKQHNTEVWFIFVSKTQHSNAIFVLIFTKIYLIQWYYIEINFSQTVNETKLRYAWLIKSCANTLPDT